MRVTRPYGDAIRKYRITQIGSGKHVLWQARMHGSHAVGSGGRPDLAIKDLHKQHRLREAHEVKRAAASTRRLTRIWKKQHPEG